MATYNITNSIPNVTSGNKTITIEADNGYNLPSSVSVSGGTLVSYNSSTGVAVVSGDNAVVSATCPLNVIPYLTFSSNYSFYLTAGSGKTWDGTLYYSTDTENWSVWNGRQISSTSSGTTKYLYLRGVGNTKITGAQNSAYAWSLNYSPVDCTGNIETLLNYQTVLAGNHPPMAAMCFTMMFYNCTNLKTPPQLPATTLADNCYTSMFYGCTSLTTAPILLPATTLTTACYSSMFRGCTQLTTPAIIADGTTQATPAAYCCNGMYYGCTQLNIYTSANGHTPFYKAIAYVQYSYSQAFYNCKIDGVTSNTGNLSAGTQYYY